MKKVRVFATVYGTNGFGDSAPVLAAGEHPVTPETERQVALGNGEVFEAPDEVAPEPDAAPEAAVVAEQAAAAPEAAEPPPAAPKPGKAKAA